MAISIYDLVEDRLPDSVKKAAASHFGWEDKYLFKSDSDNTFDRAGIGFKLIEPLDSGAYADKMSEQYTSIYGSNDLFVEAIVQHTINAVPVNRKLERSATFIHEDNIIVKDNFEKINQKEFKRGIESGCKVDAPGNFIEWFSTSNKLHAFLMPGKRFDIGNLETYYSIK